MIKLNPAEAGCIGLVIVIGAAMICVALLASCATFDDPNLTPEERQIRIDAATSIAHAALGEIFALTGNQADLKDYIADHPKEAAHILNLARLSINGAILVGAKPEVVALLKATFYRYTGEPFDIFEPLGG